MDPTTGESQIEFVVPKEPYYGSRRTQSDQRGGIGYNEFQRWNPNTLWHLRGQ